MTFVVMGLGTVFNALTNRRDPASGLDAPIFKAAVISLFPIVMLVLATQLPSLQSGLLTVSAERARVAGLHRAGAAAPARGRGEQVAAPATAARAGDAERRRKPWPGRRRRAKATATVSADGDRGGRGARQDGGGGAVVERDGRR